MSWNENSNVCGTVEVESPSIQPPNATHSGASSASSQSSRQQAGDEPLLPPSHPNVAEVRARLADASLRKEAASDDLAALRAFYGELTGPPLWITTSGFSAKAQAIIEEIEQADDWGLPAELLDPPAAGAAPSTTDGQAIEEIRLSLAILRYARYARGGRLSLRRVSTLFYQKPNVIDPKTIISEIALTIDPTSYLRELHPKHGEFKRLRQALLDLRAKPTGTDNEALIQRLIVNMERWRLMPAELGSTYVWNNIPELKARIVKQGKTIYEERIIVGTPKTPTPIFSASMQSIVFHPEWLLPKSIVEEELKLAPQNASGGEMTAEFLKRRNLKVRLKGSPVDLESVDWGAATLNQYTFVQPPGPGNALGKLKFNFPNRHAVYMHDTSQPELFNETNGALSHGCIRLRDPERLAKVLLAEDKGWSEQRVSEMLNRRKTKWVKLTSPVRVHLTYFTVRVVDDGELETFSDIYGLDGRMGSALLGRSSKLNLTP
jgi:murein L,D-transpeptidase YcbB/YkuD